MNNIFVYAIPTSVKGCLYGIAVTEKFELVASHVSSDESWAKHDMLSKTEVYTRCYPDGYELQWLGLVENHEEADGIIEEEFGIVSPDKGGEP